MPNCIECHKKTSLLSLIQELKIVSLCSSYSYTYEVRAWNGYFTTLVKGYLKQQDRGYVQAVENPRQTLAAALLAGQVAPGHLPTLPDTLPDMGNPRQGSTLSTRQEMQIYTFMCASAAARR